MAIKKFKPVTPGTRFRVGNAYAEITTDKPEKSLIEGLSKSGGRNSNGRRTSRHVGGGHKRKYRVIDFKRDKEGVRRDFRVFKLQKEFLEQSLRLNMIQTELLSSH